MPSDSEPGPRRHFDGTPPHNHGTLPPSLRPSSSLAGVDLYVAPYEHRETSDYELGRLTNGMSQLTVGGGQHRRRESFPVR
jgi:neural Wiskott-Aldrich syndrome protein